MNIGAATRLLFLGQSRDAILRTESHTAREAKRIFDLATSRANLVADASLDGCGYMEGADAQTLWTVYGKWKSQDLARHSDMYKIGDMGSMEMDVLLSRPP